GDYALYEYLLSDAVQKTSAEIWCYCLMPNHVHIIIVPSDEDGLRRTFADAHRRYTGYINARMRVTGHLWQGRFGSVVMDEEHLANAVRYVSLNPVRARLVERAQDWPWSSATAHLSGRDDKLVTVAPVLERYGDFAAFLDQEDDDAAVFRMLRQSETTGRPLGSDQWIEKLEKQTGRKLKPQKRGPKSKTRGDN
ncbi:MAG: transposase, partial [Gammaproteobacteria bacterium]|nr:transposase [Gammaproteobacteria bacterium]